MRNREKQKYKKPTRNRYSISSHHILHQQMSEEQELVRDKINLAVLYFRAGDYAKALKLYDQLVLHFGRPSVAQLKKIRQRYGLNDSPVAGSIVHPELVTVLDQRAATHEKLRNYELAYADGTKIVEVDPISCKGYLRVGKLLLRQNKEKDAYEVYRKGLSTIGKARQKHGVKVPENLLNSLKKQYQTLNKRVKTLNRGVNGNTDTNSVSKRRKHPDTDNLSEKRKKSATPVSDANPLLQNTGSRTVGLQRKLDDMMKYSQTKSTKTVDQSTFDPFSKLPVDLIETIFRHLSMKNVLSCHLVCRKWYTLLTSIPQLYNDRVVFKDKITTNEFTDGMKLIKRIVARSSSKLIKSLKLRSAFTPAQLDKILDGVVGDRDLKLEALEIVNVEFSIERFLGKLIEFKWNLANIDTITKIRLGINSSLKHPHILFQMMPKLKSLEIFIIESKLSRTNKHLLPTILPAEVEISPILETLSLINHPKLTRQFMTQSINSDTYNPFVPIISMHLSMLTSLTIVSYDFTDLESEFGAFLSKSLGLKMIYLENNQEISLKTFLTMLLVYEPNFTLDKLTFREKAITRAVNLGEYPPNSLCQLHQLRYLDIYSSSLSIKGLSRLLKICGNVKTLNIGNSNYIYFKNDKFSNVTKMNLYTILEPLPQLQKLYLPEMELDNLTMKIFNQDLKIYPNHLKFLDLSYCSLIDGTGLMNLLHGVELQELHLDGIELNKSTLNFLKASGLVQNIQNNEFRTRWKRYLVNSLVPAI